MNYREVFPKKHVFLAVIHVVSREQALENASIALNEGADGVFLISHGSVSDEELLDIYGYVRVILYEKLESPFIGINRLSVDARDVFKRIPGYLSGIWLDNLGIRLDISYQYIPNCIREARKKKNRYGWKWDGLLFGGIAFKYQKAVSYEELSEVSRIATGYCDIITTSGEATGSAPQVEKIRLIREAVRDFPVAIASGITPENVEKFMPFADCFLVATGISKNFTELDPDRVRKLARVLH